MRIFSDNPLVDTELVRLRKNHVIGLEKALKTPKQVEWLTLSGPVMDHIGPINIESSISQLSNLKVLEVEYYSSITFPESLVLLSKLHTIILLGNEFSPAELKLSSPLSDLQSLWAVYASTFTTVIVDEEFANCPKLHKLMIDDCSFSGLSHICRITSLEDLSLDCPVKEDTTCLQRLTNLKRLRLTFGFKTVPLVVSKLFLNTLSLSASNIEDIPAWVAKLETLEELDVSYTNVSKLPSGFSNLKLLDIKGSPLAKAVESLKSLMPHVQILD